MTAAVSELEDGEEEEEDDEEEAATVPSEQGQDLVMVGLTHVQSTILSVS